MKPHSSLALVAVLLVAAGVLAVALQGIASLSEASGSLYWRYREALARE